MGVEGLKGGIIKLLLKFKGDGKMLRKMLRKVLSRTIKIPALSKLLIRPILNLHGFCYSIAGSMATQLEGGIHPKHGIIRYKEWFLDNIKIDEVVLDIGCNTGLMPEVMCKKAKFVYGIDIEEGLINQAKEKRQNKNIEFICADAIVYSYEKCQPISCITMSNVLEHIENRVEFLKVLLKKVKWKNEANKKILIRVPMINREWIVIYKKQMNVEYRLDKTHFIEYTQEDFIKELEMSGINIININIRFGEIYAVCVAA
jgi:SAM-dependent methyltransferase